jgi:hypothetical protein
MEGISLDKSNYNLLFREIATHGIGIATWFSLQITTRLFKIS